MAKHVGVLPITQTVTFVTPCLLKTKLRQLENSGTLCMKHHKPVRDAATAALVRKTGSHAVFSALVP